MRATNGGPAGGASRPEALPRPGVGPPVPVGAGRRVLDVLAAGLGCVLLAPLLLVAVLAVALTDGRPVLFRQVRVGEGGRVFVLYKLRTMRRVDGPAPQVTTPGDPRITRVGRLLRGTSVDELPQLLNVLRGDMTLVGPRPETVELARRYPPECRWVFQHRPGLTGPTQVGMREVKVPPGEDVERHYLTVLVPRRVALDAEYLRAPTLRATVRLLGRTVHHLVRPESTAVR